MSFSYNLRCSSEVMIRNVRIMLKGRQKKSALRWRVEGFVRAENGPTALGLADWKNNLRWLNYLSKFESELGVFVNLLRKMHQAT